MLRALLYCLLVYLILRFLLLDTIYLGSQALDRLVHLLGQLGELLLGRLILRLQGEGLEVGGHALGARQALVELGANGHLPITSSRESDVMS